MSENNDNLTININLNRENPSDNTNNNQSRYGFPWPGGWSPIPICFPTQPDFNYNEDFFAEGRIHNLLLKDLMSGLPAVDLDVKEAQGIFKERLIILNEELALGYDTDKLNKINFVPPAKRKFYDHMVQLFESSEAAKDKALVKAIELLMKKSAEHKDDLTVMANYAKELHGQYLNKVQDPRVLTNAMSVAYASANLYSNPDNAGKLLGVSGGSTVIKEIDWNKVAWCDVIGSMVGPEGSAIASLCSIINQS